MHIFFATHAEVLGVYRKFEPRRGGVRLVPSGTYLPFADVMKDRYEA
jgi:hypothetical protein